MVAVAACSRGGGGFSVTGNLFGKEPEVIRGLPGIYGALDFSRVPMAVMNGSGQIICYANPAFCRLTGKSREELIDMSCAELFPEGDECLLLLARVYSTGNPESHTEQEHAKPHPFYWSYEIWPVLEGRQDDSYPVGVILQVTETAPLHRRATVMNEALLLSAVRQHELMEGAEILNVKLQAEIQERQRAEAAIEQLAFYDPLTDLPNRRLLMDRLHLALLACCRTMHHGAILFIDLDHFKALNDTQGHHLGDLLLQQVAHRLTACVRECDTVARLGGDEFVVMIQELSEDSTEANAQAKQIGIKVLAALNEPYLLAGYEHRSTGSVGVTLFSKNREPVEDLLKRADLAQYRAKTAGGNAMQFFDPEMQHTVTARAVLEADLRRSLQEGQFLLHYQPQVDCNGHLTGAEALLRWRHPSRGLLSPAEFIAFAEGNGMIESIGQWVVEAACIQLMTWSLKPDTAHLTLAINISAREFCHPEFVTRMLTIIDEVGADPRKLMLEFTERAMFGPVEETLAKMSALKARGVCFALDDFGIGFSSLASLKSLPLDQLKIDRSFVRDVHTNPTDAIIASAIIALGQSLGLTVIAEGVETEEQRNFLASHGCRIYQGFLFGRPGPVENLSLIALCC
jgi:diguanylate cyclase (GGDEF)-like protein/PAS domain S-box-containing protein